MSVKKIMIVVVAGVIGLLSFLIIFLAVNSYFMNRMVEEEIQVLIDDVGDSTAKTYSEKTIEGLPDPVRRYFHYALQDGQQYVRFAHIKAKGYFKRPLQKNWAEMTTQQYFITNPIGMIFDAEMRQSTFMWFDIRDKYYQKTAGMHVNLLSGFNVLNETGGNALNTTTFLRCIGEAVMFPTSLLPSAYIQWEPIDENRAKAIVRDGENAGTYIFYFNKIGEIIKYESKDRYDRLNNQLKKVGSIAVRSDYKKISGMMIPTRFLITRILPDGTHEDFWKGEITDITFNQTSQF
mgnify:FL=1